MNKEYCLKLCLCVYRVTKCFPQNEPLKNQIREKANEILVGLILSNPTPSFSGEKKLLKDFEIIDNYFEIAKNQNWLDSQNFLFLEKEYDRIRDRFEQDNRTPRSSLSLVAGQDDKTDRTDALLPRHRKILEILPKRGKSQVGDFQKIFPEITKRTLRRDFEFLLNQKLIKRQGEKNNTFYKLAV
jgi:hypothetical protein